ncbi:MAG: MXAN_2562 family outer membrane beta-barrel protein [Polyangiaceae bacterium]|nr:MXAN_2562 family outer membrane beta-barrel protein [Polyangiaceae bacterium]
MRRLVGWTAVALVVVSWSGSALAQGYHGPDGPTWHRHSPRHDQTEQSWALEFRLGPYSPKIDDEFGGSGPYEEVFGGGRRWFVGLEVDYQALRIPYIGTLGPGFGVSYTKMSANAKLAGQDEDSAETTSLWIMPMYVAAVLRVDVFADKLGIPLVPYVKGGLGYALWKASNGLGTSVYGEGDDEVVGKGRTYGWHFAPGLMLQLDVFDQHAARQLDNSVGVNHSYFFLEWMMSGLDGFGADDQMRVGTTTWVMGLAFEF